MNNKIYKQYAYLHMLILLTVINIFGYRSFVTDDAGTVIISIFEFEERGE